MSDGSHRLFCLLSVSYAARRARERELCEPQAASSLLCGSCARELPAATGAPLPSWELGSLTGLCLEHPLALPQQCGHPQVLQCLELQKQRRSSMKCHCPPACGQLLLPFPSGEQKVPKGCRVCKRPHPSLIACCLLLTHALHGGQRSFPARCEHSWDPLLPCHGTWPHDSPKISNAGASGPAEDKGGPVLLPAFFFFFFLLSLCLLLATAQHPQPVQGQAEGWAKGVAVSAESRGSQ